MAISTCAKCSGHYFELHLAEPRNSQFKLNFVQCASCGAVVGVQEYFSIGEMMKKQDAAIKAIAAALNVYVDLE